MKRIRFKFQTAAETKAAWLEALVGAGIVLALAWASVKVLTGKWLPYLN